MRVLHLILDRLWVVERIRAFGFGGRTPDPPYRFFPFDFAPAAGALTGAFAAFAATGAGSAGLETR